jgi:predicted nucleic acid-binding protein
MKCVLDTAVAVAFLRPSDTHHQRAFRFVTPVLMGKHELVLPTIFEVEVLASLARASVPAGDGRASTAAFLNRAKVVTLGPLAARKAAQVAVSCRLRGMDAIYAWVAQREGIPLVTFDRELVDRASAICEVICPA